MIFINSPGNPTGWMVERDQQKTILNFCRDNRIWAVADEVYGRLVYDRHVAPSFIEIAEPEDPVVVVNSFSKSWAMTGWRLGWLTHPKRLTEKIGDLIEYNTSGTPEFLQEAGIKAVQDGEDTIGDMVERCRAGRDAAEASSVLVVCAVSRWQRRSSFDVNARGVLNAYSVLFGSRARRDASLVDAADDAMAAGASLPELLAAVEAAAAAK